MAAVGGVERGKAHQTMHAVFTLHISVTVGAIQLKRCRLDTRDIALLAVEQLDAVLVAFSPTNVHTEQHLGPVATLRAARTGIDRQNHTHRILLIPHHIPELKLLYGLQRRLIAFVHLLFGGIALVEEIKGHRTLVELLARLLKIGHPRLRKTDFLENLLRLLGIVPKIRTMRNLFLFSYFFLLPINVKDTSLAH